MVAGFTFAAMPSASRVGEDHPGRNTTMVLFAFGFA